MDSMEKTGPDWKILGGGALIALLVIISIYLATNSSRMETSFAREMDALRGERDAIQTELDEQIATVGDRDTLRGEIEGLTPEVETLRQDRDIARAEVDALSEQRVALESETANLTTSRDELQSDIARFEEEVTPLREEIAQFEERRSALSNEVTSQTEELAAIGARLEDARGQEADLSKTIAQLSEDRARLAQEAQDAESRLQMALEGEATAREEAEGLRNEVAGLEDQRQSIETEVARIDERRGEVQSELAAAEEQRLEVQDILANLTQQVESRATRLSEIETRLSDMLDTASSETPTFEPGNYRLGDVPVTFRDDGTFSIMGGDEEGAVGEFRTEQGNLVLTSSEVGMLRCTLSQTDGGYALSNDTGECKALAGEEFVLSP